MNEDGRKDEAKRILDSWNLVVPEFVARPADAKSPQWTEKEICQFMSDRDTRSF